MVIFVMSLVALVNYLWHSFTTIFAGYATLENKTPADVLFSAEVAYQRKRW